MERIASITRDTNETQISMSLNLDGSGRGNISTGIGFFDHMLNSFARHGFFDLDLAEGPTWSGTWSWTGKRWGIWRLRWCGNFFTRFPMGRR